jgi:hypothetical protein
MRKSKECLLLGQHVEAFEVNVTRGDDVDLDVIDVQPVPFSRASAWSDAWADEDLKKIIAFRPYSHCIEIGGYSIGPREAGEDSQSSDQGESWSIRRREPLQGDDQTTRLIPNQSDGVTITRHE